MRRRLDLWVLGKTARTIPLDLPLAYREESIWMRRISILIILVLLGTVSAQALAVEVGGELGVSWAGSFQKDGSFEGDFNDIVENLDLELLLPRIGNTEFCYAITITKPLQDLLAEGEASYFTKKLYLKQRFSKFHLTVGRQPVSWSFGSLFNPVDYTLGAVSIDKESVSKYTDALEVYIPLNWNSSLTMVASFPTGFTSEMKKLKWGMRGRFGVKGYDLTLNYVQEPERLGVTGGVLDSLFRLLPKQRAGFTLKGDLGDLGVYGSLGRYFGQEMASSTSYLVGTDYSYNLNPHTKISARLEYLGVELGSLKPEIRAFLLKMDSKDQRLDLLTGNINYSLDEFSSLSLLAMVNLDDKSLFFSPGFQSALFGSVDFTISGVVFLGEKNTLFAPGDLIPPAQIFTGISYAF